MKVATGAYPAVRGDQLEAVGRLDANPDEARWLGACLGALLYFAAVRARKRPVPKIATGP